ncbi:cell division protein SepF [Lapidilactobacillus gannanensis]|jgi:cell division inhibitor SepF|uniref:Cell division protein SepF n=1 Tax=Lapidilactobacillus gannanensis TaxID=2486002 RepID=A0ABW4BRA7_9LACO|nr:cell division protein SepF [Lapidilactobacillus gannanensis]MCH4058226.1 cell division protein SepF [Lactobacillaceae bacterium]
MAFEKLSHFFGISDEDEYDEAEYQSEANDESTPVAPTTNSTATGNVVAMNQAGRNVARKIIIFEPRIYADAKDIATNLLNNQAVIVNFTQLDDSQARRIVDFLTGTVFALKGEIQRVGDQIFLCTPPKFEIEGTISENLKNDQGL